MKKAYTLAEVLMCMVIIGFLAIIMVRNIKTKDFTEKNYTANALKIIQNMQQASLKIRELEKENCPTESFMVSVLDTWEYTLVDSSGNNLEAAEVIDLYGKYLKFEDSGFKFCDYTTYCSNDDIIGAKIAPESYIGIEITSIEDCPEYYIPGSDATTAGKGKCWGKLYIDVDGKKGPNTLGKDIFVYGLNETGVAY